MTRDGVLPLTVESGNGRANLLVDACLPLASLLPPLAAACGADSTAGWEVNEGQRRLQPHTCTLAELGVVAGAVLRLTPADLQGPANAGQN